MLCGQQQPQKPSPDSQQEALPCPVSEDLPASPGQEVEDPCSTTSSSARSPWDSSSAWDSGSSEADGRRCFVLGGGPAARVPARHPPRVSLHSREGRTHWSRTAARRLWRRGLCTMTPALEPELETHLLRAALHAVFTLGMEKDTTQVQDLPRVLPDLLDTMLGNLLAESPDTDRLQYILENSAEFPRMGHHMAQLALSVSDPAKDISRQAREGVYQLYHLLLHQRGKEPSWEMAPARRVRLGPQPISLRLTPAGG
ncbi:uncharacterized protein LOC117882904 isoform X4 [Trachemys scripta elegans]|uniref:uncharacterized protein LOC117882904 isoform X4 n=1 Tax=Trachemys scripta elegans TaxID=31138 RepID=UPI001551ED88|nr:uncharacterized protein LOC117882904 isoform X4 [Trachemys scripta elegans]